MFVNYSAKYAPLSNKSAIFFNPQNMPHNIFLTVRRVDLKRIFIEQKTNDMEKTLTIDDLIIEAHPGGQNCRSCPLHTVIDEIQDCIIGVGNRCEDLDVELLLKHGKNVCFTHTITLKATTDEHI